LVEKDQASENLFGPVQQPAVANFLSRLSALLATCSNSSLMR